jgi:predicted ATP-binding protein involved in virulence
MSNDQLIKLSKNVFLTAPSSQVFQFLTNLEKQAIFTEFDSGSSYYDNVDNAKEVLDNFFTYDFASTELILKSFKKALDEDAKQKRKSGIYGEKYDKLREDLKNVIDNKEIKENEDGNKVIFALKETQQELSPEDLSHGELKKLGIYIWLKYIVDEESIVLMDEVDIALHPKWQYELIDDLVKYSKNSQFLLATHSPQIMSSTYYKNIIILENQKAKQFTKPPLDRDINTISTVVMGASDFPEKLKELHKEYRELFDKGELQTPKAKQLKKDILEYESENSSFFQEINFDLALL